MKNLKYFLVVAFAAIIAYFSFVVKSTDTFQYLGCYGSLFLIYFLLIKNLEDTDIKWALYASIVIRFIVIPSMNFSSVDVWRYLWDGNMQAIGFSPYTIAPKEVMDAGFNTFKDAGNLFHQVASARENSVYPPFLQMIFYCCVKASLSNQHLAIILMKFILVVAEIISLNAMLQLLAKFKMPLKNIFIYAFNPLIIIELISNVHFESLTICFLLVSLLFYVEQKNARAISFYVFSILTGIIPIVFLPYFLFKNNWKQNLKLLIIFSFLFFSFLAIYFYVINVRKEYLSSLQLYFNQFEFNSFLFYWLNVLLPNRLQPTAGAILSRTLIAVSLLLLLFWNWRSRNENIEKWLSKILLFWMLFLFSFTVINAWYIAPILMLTVFRKNYTILLWSTIAIITSFFMHQINHPFDPHIFTLFWYLTLIVVFFWKDVKLLKR